MATLFKGVFQLLYKMPNKECCETNLQIDEKLAKLVPIPKMIFDCIPSGTIYMYMDKNHLHY